MSEKREMKKIDLGTLDQAEHKTSVGKFKKLAVLLAVLAALGVGGMGLHRMMTGDVLASRFTVNKMVCPACVITVKEVTDKIPGVIDADVSLASQNVTVKFREKQVTAEQIQQAIAAAGYPIKLDALFKPEENAEDREVLATVNGRPVFKKDARNSIVFSDKKDGKPDPAADLFTAIGKEILLQVADGKKVVVQPQEVDEELDAMAKSAGVSKEELLKRAVAQYGSMEKVNQIVSQKMGLRKLLVENVVIGVKDPEAKKRKILEWVGEAFRDSQVKIVDPSAAKMLASATGQHDWNMVWPRMIGKDSPLKNVLLR